MKNVLLFATLWLALIVQSTWSVWPGFARSAPDLIVFCVVMIGFLRGERAGLIFGLLIGLVMDISFGLFLGQSAFAFAAIGYFAGYVRSLFLRDSLLLALLISGVSNELFVWLAYGTSRLFHEVTLSAHSVLLYSARTSLSTLLLTLLLYVPFRKAFAKKPRVRYDDESVEA